MNTNMKIKKSQTIDDFYQPDENVFNENMMIWVDDQIKFDSMLDYFEQTKPKVIGLDCEWKPMFDQEDNNENNLTDSNDLELELNGNGPSNGGTKSKRPNILQIATSDKCFIIEFRDLPDSLSENSVQKFGELIFFADDLIKLGYAFDQDSSKLSHVFPQFQHRFSEFVDDVINLDKVVTEVVKVGNVFGLSELESSEAKKIKGLSKLTQRCFGKPLDKSECMSNWGNKPLRFNQMKYAALDAFILIQIHEFLQMRMKLLKIEYDYTQKRQYF